jgi:hypothetical protein
MIAIHNHFTQQMRNRLKTIGMGLGLVRLLQDAGLTEEARMTLSALENGIQGVAKETDMASQNPCKANRLKGIARGFSLTALADRYRCSSSHKSCN